MKRNGGPLDNFETVTRVGHELTVESLGPFVLVTDRTHTVETRTLDDRHVGRQDTYGSAIFCFTKKHFDERLKKHGRDPYWLYDRFTRAGSEQDAFEAVTEEFMAAYREGRWPEAYDVMSDDLAATLRKGAYDRVVVVRVAYDGFLYDHEGMPVRRKFQLDYIDTGLNDLNYRVDELVASLKAEPKVSNVKVKGVERYNRDTNGRRAVEFAYLPDPEEFLELATVDSFVRHSRIREALGTESFLKSPNADDYVEPAWGEDLD